MRAILPDATDPEILAAVPLAGAEDTLSWLKSTYNFEISAAGTIAREQEPRWDIRADFRPSKGLTGLLTNEIQKKQRDDALARHAAAASEATVTFLLKSPARAPTSPIRFKHRSKHARSDQWL